MRLMTVPGVFRPRSDSIMLARAAACRSASGARALDLFTGSGVVAIAAALAGAEASATDVSRRAVACTRLNARLNGRGVRALRGDMFDPVRDERFDLITANPPYVPGSSASEARGAARAWEAGADGRELIDRLCDEAPRYLRPGGTLLVVHSSICRPELTRERLEAGGLETEVVESRRGRLGPLLSARAGLLERRGLVAPGEREEEILVLGATRPPADAARPERVSAVAAGNEAA